MSNASLPNLSLVVRLFLSGTTIGIAGLVALALSGSAITLFWLVPVTVIIIVAFIFAKLIANPWQQTAQTSRTALETMQVVVANKDDLSCLRTHMEMLQTRLDDVISTVSAGIKELDSTAHETAETTAKGEEFMDKQKAQIDQIAVAMHQMTTAVQDVAGSIAQSSEASQQADQNVIEGKKVLDTTIGKIQYLDKQIENAITVITKLAENSREIGTVVDVIRGVADQTNLLALNAAIEAARAGEQGRGFSVVADEVRTLAGHTQSATQQIQEMVNTLQSGAENAVNVMEEGGVIVKDSVSLAAEAGASFETIMQAVNDIMKMSAQISATAEEQSAVSEEISQNIISISKTAELTLSGGQGITRANQNMAREASLLCKVIREYNQTQLSSTI